MAPPPEKREIPTRTFNEALHIIEDLEHNILRLSFEEIKKRVLRLHQLLGGQ